MYLFLFCADFVNSLQEFFAKVCVSQVLLIKINGMISIIIHIIALLDSFFFLFSVFVFPLCCSSQIKLEAVMNSNLFEFNLKLC